MPTTTRKRPAPKKDTDRIYLIHSVKNIVGLGIVLLAAWWVVTGFWNHMVYNDCTVQLCKTNATAGIARGYNVDINADGSVKLLNAPVVVSTHEPPVIVQQPQPQVVVVPASQPQVIQQPAPQVVNVPQPRVIYLHPRPCCGGVQRPVRYLPSCNPTGGGFPQGNPCQPYGARRPPQFMGMLQHVLR